MHQPMSIGDDDGQGQLLSFKTGLEAWLLETADKPTTPLTKSDFTAIRERVRAKIPAA